MQLITEADITSLGWQPTNKMISSISEQTYQQEYKLRGAIELCILVRASIIEKTWLLIKLHRAELVKPVNVSTKQDLEQLMYLLNINQ